MVMIVTCVIVCERCHKVQHVGTQDVMPYHDVGWPQPEGWDYGKDDNTELCPECLAKEKTG